MRERMLTTVMVHGWLVSLPSWEDERLTLNCVGVGAVALICSRSFVQSRNFQVASIWKSCRATSQCGLKIRAKSMKYLVFK